MATITNRGCRSGRDRRVVEVAFRRLRMERSGTNRPGGYPRVRPFVVPGFVISLFVIPVFVAPAAVMPAEWRKPRSLGIRFFRSGLHEGINEPCQLSSAPPAARSTSRAKRLLLAAPSARRSGNM